MKKALSKNILSVWYGTASKKWTLVWRLSLPLLWPLSWLFRGLIACRRRCFSFRHILCAHTNAITVPVIVVGNITLGGTGKTPLLCTLADGFKRRGLRVGIVSRGYGGSWDRSGGMPRFVLSADDASVVGDEPILLARRTGCPVVIGRDRVAAVKMLSTGNSVDLILSDDGLQHYALKRDVEILVVDAERGLGNGLCLPAGALREPPSRLNDVDFVVVNSAANTENADKFRADQLFLNVTPRRWRHVLSHVEKPLPFFTEGMRVHAVAGIGNPARFFTTLRSMGLHVIEHPLPDHHLFSAADLLFADHFPVVMTEKDAVKCADFAPENSYALIVDACVSETLFDKLINATKRRKSQ